MEQVPQVPGYDVIEPLGEGATSTVWRARRRGDGLVVALKVLTPANGDVAAGLREAGLLASVRHQHVVRLHDVLPLPDPDTGRPTAVALATQLAGGGSLAQVLARRRILSAGELVTALQPVAGALADLHREGIVHGDISTGNVLFRLDGMPLLADLGAARVTGAHGGDPQGTGARSGLVAPEVVEGFLPTQESDVYQLGAIAWLCLAGEPPGPPWSRGVLDELAPGLPDGLADLVTRCLAPEPGDRPDAEEVVLALLASTAPEPIEVAPDADPGHGLTERLRRQAQEDLGSREVTAAPRRRLHPLRRARAKGGITSAASGARSAKSSRTTLDARAQRDAAVRQGAGVGPRRGQHRHETRPAGRRWIVVVAAVLLLMGALAASPLIAPDLARGVSSLLHGGPAAAAAGSVQPVKAGPVEDRAGEDGPGEDGSDTPRPGEEQEEEAEEVDDGESGDRPLVPGDDVGELLQVLVDGRAHAWEKGDPALLADVMAPGSPALKAETEALEELAEQGLTYADVDFGVEDASVVDEDDGRLTMDARVTRGPLQARDSEGRTRTTVGSTADDVRLVLARADSSSAWLLWSWEPGATG